MAAADGLLLSSATAACANHSAAHTDKASGARRGINEVKHAQDVVRLVQLFKYALIVL